MGRMLGAILGLVAIVNGIGIVFDAECESVSFGGQGGGRVLIATCYADGTGALPGTVAGLGMAILGFAIIVVSAQRR